MGRRRIRQTKSFWYDASKIFPEEMDLKVNQFLKDTPGILCTPEFVPEISWGEVGGFVICNVTYYLLTTKSIIDSKKES